MANDIKDNDACCVQTEKVYEKAGAEELLHNHKPGEAHDHQYHDDDDDDEHDHSHGSGGSVTAMFMPAGISLVLLLAAIALDNYIPQTWFKGYMRLGWYIAAYLPVGWPVLKEAAQSIGKGEIFSEFLLMGIATVGAFSIGEYPEGVAVMLFYSIGEAFQALAVARAKNNIKALMDQRPDTVNVRRGNEVKTIPAQNAAIGETILLKPGEKLGLDGTLLSATAAFNTAALTGESKPDTKTKGETVLAGMINLNTAAEVQVSAAYNDSKLSRILELVQNAAGQKAATELFIKKFAKVYTPVVVFMAIAICLLPYFFVHDYHFKTWLYRALVFLVISCPCALVISIPLGYFGGIGAAGRRGILVKGGNFLDALAKVQHVVMDKTGTLTKGVFKVQEVKLQPGTNEKELLEMVNALESKSSHPIATAIAAYVGKPNAALPLENVEEMAGMGLRAMVQGKELLAGNFKLMDKYGVQHNVNTAQLVTTVIAIAYGGSYAGYITIADELKPEAQNAIKSLADMGVKCTMLSGDKSAVVKHVAEQLQIDNAYGDLLPEGKVDKVKEIKAHADGTVAFVGDGVNDAPVIAISDVGIAMGGLGSDATIETADVVIQDDNPEKIALAIKTGRATRKIVWQNITMAFAVKVVVLALGAGGIATMWEAVFADVGVALLAILNAVRIQRMRI